MIRLLFTIVTGVVLGAIVHLVSVLALPRIASQDAYSRLTPTTKLNAVTQLLPADPSYTLMPYMDPAFAVAVCRYDLSGGPLKLGYASGVIGPGKSVTVHLMRTGNFLIGCAFHYHSGMQDVIVVHLGATPGPQATKPAQ